jgi:hypothetical protein
MTPAWSIELTGAKQKIADSVRAWPTPDGEENQAQFLQAVQAIAIALERSPASHVALKASGFSAHDGRAEVSIKIDPVNLHV